MPNKDKKRPNIIMFLTDDQGYWALGCNGNEEIITPNIDRLAAEGARFENFYCASPVCSPARASLLTGRIPSQHGIHDWIREGNVGKGAIEYLKGIRGYTDDLVELGYTCALSGKWHMGDSAHPQKGFSRWYTHQRGGGDYYNAPMIKNGQLIEQEGYVTDAITDNAIEFLDEMNAADQPFYLSVHYTAPHSPWTNGNHPKELTDLYRDCPFHSLPGETTPHPWAVFSTAPDALTKENVENPRESLIGYYAAVTGVDRGVGRIMEHLRRIGADDNTMVVYTADNGFNLGHHGIWGKGNGTFPMNMYDTSIRVPMIMWHPDSIQSAMVVHDMVSAYDYMPTILDYVGRQVTDPTLPGRSYRYILEGEHRKQDEEGMIVIFDEYGPVRMIRSEYDKYVCRYPYGPDEYYDLKEDPEERNNLIAEDSVQGRIMELHAYMERWFEKYVDASRDGRGERVTGNGQLDMAGSHRSRLRNYEPNGYEYHVKT